MAATYGGHVSEDTTRNDAGTPPETLPKTESHDQPVPEAYAAFMRQGWGDSELDLPPHPITPWAAARRERLASLRQPTHPSGEDTSLLSLTVARGLDELPDAQRQVLVLRFYADLPVRSIAEELGVPEGTVKSRLHTAVRALRARLHEDEVV